MLNTLITRTDDPDVVVVKFDAEDDFGDEYFIATKGFFRWKRYYIAEEVADCAAGGCNSGIFTARVSRDFLTLEEAREALYSGCFEHV